MPLVVTDGFVIPATTAETEAPVVIEQVPPLSASVITFVRVPVVYAAVAAQLLTLAPLTVTPGVAGAVNPARLP